jgi:hypothetical protein
LSTRLTRDDLVPGECGAVELSWLDPDALTHAYAIPSITYPGRWHAGCVRREGELYWWSTTGLVDNPMALGNAGYAQRLFAGIRSS